MLLKKRIGIRATIISTMCFIAVGVVATAVAVWKIRSDAIEDSYRSTGNLALVLGEQMARSVSSVERALTTMQDRLFSLGIADANDLGFLANAFGHLILKSQL